jgi:predicted O-linked N-acetylglucosamine transferase (SPINDLY family)
LARERWAKEDMEISHTHIGFLLDAAQKRRSVNDLLGASVLLDELLRIEPDHPEALLCLATMRIANNPHAAALLAGRIIKLSPNNVAAWTLLGQAVSALSRADDAVQAFTRAAQLDPNDANAQSNLSIALMRAGNPWKAIDAAKCAIALNLKLPEAFASLGHAYNVLEMSDEAVSAFTSALRLRSNFPDALLGLARAEQNSGRPSRAIVALLRASEISGGRQEYLASLATAYREIGDLKSARTVSRKAAAHSHGLSYLASNTVMSEQYDPEVSDEGATDSAKEWGLYQVSMTRAAPRTTRFANRGAGKLHVGYVSADIYRHPVGWLGAGPISSHDRANFHITIYANQTAADELTSSVKSSVDAWVPILGLDDDTVAAKVVADEIDVLVDLSGHTAGNRLGVFARRAADVQLSWLGYFATTGLPTMDYVLLDDHHLVPGAEQLFVERVIRLPGSRFCYCAPAYAADPAPPPSLERGVTTFGSFNNAAKINDNVLALWAQVLAAVPDSSLLLKWRSYVDPILQGRTRFEFSTHGIDPERIKFDGKTPHGDMLAQYSEVDIALDPFPFSGGMTSCEALWMGVPVVTLPGSRPVSRQTHSILLTIGHPEFSAATPAAYLAIAADLARKRDGLATLRKSLRSEMTNSSLCDAKGFAARLESIYRDLVG